MRKNSYSSKRVAGLTSVQKLVKRSFDIFFSLVGLCTASSLILVAWLAASVDTRSNGFFLQTRVGREGRFFRVIKIKTMRPIEGLTSSVSMQHDPRITTLGAFLRRTKIDELPQLWNVLVGEMSFVGPRPDVPGFADELVGDDKIILSIRPGITGPASLRYRNEEVLLARQDAPEVFNREVIWPDKVCINREYIKNWSLINDVRYLFQTVFK